MIIYTYTAQTLNPSYWSAMKALRLMATQREPHSFWLQYGDEIKLSKNEWKKRCTEVLQMSATSPLDIQCAVGLLKRPTLCDIPVWKAELVGQVELFRSDRNIDSLTLGRLYICDEDRIADNSSKILDLACAWALSKTQLKRIVAAARDDNPAAIQTLLNFGFADIDSNATSWPTRESAKEDGRWPTGEKVSQTWYEYHLVRPNTHSKDRPLDHGLR